MPQRCSYREGQQQCPYEGTGVPLLCAAHRLALETMAAQQDPVEALLGHASAALSSEFEQLLQRGRDAVRRAIPRADPGRGSRTTRRTPPRQRAATPPPPQTAKEDPRTVLGFAPSDALTKAKIKARQRALADLFHPDKGGSTEAMQRVNEAAQTLLRECR